MLTTDYSGIAARYDRNPIRSAIPRDPLIESLYARGHGGFRVLDLACGTGNYLRKQIECYGDLDVEWHGLDRSPEMLEQAKAKGLKAALVSADALKCPIGMRCSTTSSFGSRTITSRTRSAHSARFAAC